MSVGLGPSDESRAPNCQKTWCQNMIAKYFVVIKFLGFVGRSGPVGLFINKSASTLRDRVLNPCGGYMLPVSCST